MSEVIELDIERPETTVEQLISLEEALIGSAFFGLKDARWVVANVVPEAFILPKNRALFEEIAALTKDGVTLDESNLKLWLTKTKRLAAAGGVDHLSRVIEQSFMHSAKREYARTIMEAFAIRQIQERAKAILQSCETGRLENLREQCFAIARNLSGSGSDTLLSSAVDIEAKEALLPSVPTGVPWLDRQTNGGYYGGELSLVVAARGTGKSSWMVTGSIACAKRSLKVGYATLEMPAEQLQARMVQQICGWSHRPRLSGPLQGQFEAAKEQVEGYDIRWYDPNRDRYGDRYLERFLAWSIDVHDSIGMDVLFVDYGQKFMTKRNGENRTRELDFVADELERLAGRLRIPVICGSQLTADPAGKGPGRSKDSIRFEDNAALVLNLTRGQDSDTAKLYIGKNRHGPDHIQRALEFDRDRVRYVDTEEPDYPAQSRPAQRSLPGDEYDPYTDE